jgi:hypothetical protein
MQQNDITYAPMHALLCYTYKNRRTKQEILWKLFSCQSIRKANQILAEKKAKDEDARLVIFRRGRLVRRAENVRRCLECPCHFTLSRSEGSVSMGREMLRCAQHDMAVYLPSYLSLVTRNARPLKAGHVLPQMLR